MKGQDKGSLVDEIKQVINEFEDIFRKPHELPHDCSRNYMTSLKEEGKSSKSSHFHYPHFQKNEIETL